MIKKKDRTHMDEKFTLSQIGLYNTQRVSDTLSRKLFVVRLKQFDLLMDSLHRTKQEDSPQHHLIIGQRGMGKTTLLKRMEVELRTAPWKERFIPLLFPEEQYNVRSLSEFWLNCIDAMADVMDMEHEKEMAEEIDTVVARLMEIEEEEKRSHEAYGFLVAAAHKLNRRPVLLIDNISLVFNRLTEKEQHTLRSYMAKAGAPIIVGGNSVVLETVNDYRAPFYDAFLIHYLDKLKMEELIEILVNLAHLMGEPGLLAEIKQHTSRIKALHQLTGGNPRTAVMLFRLIVKGFSNDINEDLEALLDEATPLYKARFEELSPQMQVIVDAIAMNWDPITLERLREITRFENSQISPQLKRLTDLGWIEKPATQQGKGGAYEMSERMFNIWFLMRRSSRRQKRGVFCLSKFMEAYYGENIEEVAKKCLSHALISPTHIMEALAAAKLTLDPQMKEQLYSKSRETLFDLSQNKPEIFEMFEKTDIFGENGEDDMAALLKEYKREKAKEHWHAVDILLDKLIEITSHLPLQQATIFRHKGRNYIELRQFEKCEFYLKESLRLNSKDENTYLLLAILYHDIYKKYEQSKAFCEEAIRINSNRAISFYFLGQLYQNELNDWQQAEQMYLTAVEKAPDDSDYSLALAKLYRAHNQEEKAEKLYLTLLKANPENDKIYSELGKLYLQKKEYGKAEKVFKKVTELKPQELNAWIALGVVQFNTAQYERAEKNYRTALAIDPKQPILLFCLGTLYEKQEKYAEAEKMYKKSIGQQPSIILFWSLANLYKMYLGNYKKAEKNYLKAIQLENKIYWGIRKDLADLYENYLNDNAKAIDIYLETIALTSDPEPKYLLVRLYRDKMNNMEEAEKIFQEIGEEETETDRYKLNQALFELYKKNNGLASEYFKKALHTFTDTLPAENMDLWIYFAKTVIQIQEASWLTHQLETEGYDTILAPYYHAVKLFTQKNPETYLDTIAKEIRDIAQEMAHKMGR